MNKRCQFSSLLDTSVKGAFLVLSETIFIIIIIILIFLLLLNIYLHYFLLNCHFLFLVILQSENICWTFVVLHGKLFLYFYTFFFFFKFWFWYLFLQSYLKKHVVDILWSRTTKLKFVLTAVLIVLTTLGLVQFNLCMFEYFCELSHKNSNTPQPRITSVRDTGLNHSAQL